VTPAETIGRFRNVPGRATIGSWAVGATRRHIKWFEQLHEVRRFKGAAGHL